MKKLSRVTDSLSFLAWSAILFYIGWTTAPADRAKTVVGVTFLAGLIAWSLISSTIRQSHMRQFAASTGLVYTDDSLPRNLVITRTSFALRDYTISNCMEGNVGGITAAIFDVSHRSGKSTISETIVAFPRKGPHAISDPPIDVIGSYQFEEAGDWIIAWMPRRTVRAEELEYWCVELHNLATELLAEARGESEARPRLFRWMT